MTAIIPVSDTHRFIAAPPDPKPHGFTPSLDLERRSTCSCGWKAEANSRTSQAASDLWYETHRAAVAV